MTGWRSVVVEYFKSHVHRLTIVTDPDGLLSDPCVAAALCDAGIEMIDCAQTAEFPTIYEKKCRELRDWNKYPDTRVLLRLPHSSIDVLPHDDIVNAGKQLSIDREFLFPLLSSDVVKFLDHNFLSILFEEHKKLSSKKLGELETRNFILRYVYSLDIDAISTEIDLLGALLKWHINDLSLPPIFHDHFVQSLKSRDIFHAWPLDLITNDRAAFYSFLQERWKIFLRDWNKNGFFESESIYLFCPGPHTLSFDHPIIYPYIERLFNEGELKPVILPVNSPVPQDWRRKGVVQLDQRTD